MNLYWGIYKPRTTRPIGSYRYPEGTKTLLGHRDGKWFENIDYDAHNGEMVEIEHFEHGEYNLRRIDSKQAQFYMTLYDRLPYIPGNRLFVSEFSTVSCPTVKISDVRKRGFQVIDAAQKKVAHEFARKK